MIGKDGKQYTVKLDYAIAHEIEHYMNGTHVDSAGLFLSLTKQCSGLYGFN